MSVVDLRTLHAFAADTKGHSNCAAGCAESGPATGQGKNLSGGTWWVVAPSGSWIKKTAGSGGGQGGY